LEWIAQATSLMRMIFTVGLQKLCNRAKDLTRNFDFNNSTYEILFLFLEVLEEFIFYRHWPIPLADKDDGKGNHFYHDEHSSGLHLSDDGALCLDADLVDKAMEMLAAIHINARTEKESTQGISDNEIKVRKRGSEEFQFWEQVKRYFDMYAMNSPSVRLKLMEQLSRLLIERNRVTRFTYRRKKNVRLEHFQDIFQRPSTSPSPLQSPLGIDSSSPSPVTMTQFVFPPSAPSGSGITGIVI